MLRLLQGAVCAAALAALPGVAAAQDAATDAVPPSSEAAVPAPELAASAASTPAEDTPTAPDAATLADMRASLDQLSAALQSLRAELRAGGAPAFQAAGGDSAIDRMNAIEVEIARLTARSEELGNRIDRIVADGTNRLGDLEFRLCEMTEGCDLGALTTPPLGGMPFQPGGLATQASSTTPNGDVSRGADAAPGGASTAAERAAFDRATETLRAGDAAGAADQFARFAADHAGGPLAIEARWQQGVALEAADDSAGAAAAWLQVFSSDPNGTRSPDALLGLGRLAANAGRTEQACNYLGEVSARFAGTPAATDAEGRRASLTCPTAPTVAAGDADPEAAADAADPGLDVGAGATPDPGPGAVPVDGG